MRNAPSLSVIITTHNRKDNLIRLVNSISKSNYSQKNLEIIVVDDASNDGTFQELKKKFPSVSIIRNKRELLTAASRNKGIANAKGDYFFVVDDDNILDKNCIVGLVKLMEDDPKIGIAAPLMYYLKHPNRIWCAGIKRNMTTSLTKYFGRDYIDTNQFNSKIDSDDFPNAFMVRKKVIEKVGLFDEINFPIHYEEADFGERVRRAGYKVICNPESKIWHDIPPLDETHDKSRLFHVHSRLRAYYSGRNRIIFHKKYSNWWQFLMFIFLFNWLLTVYYIVVILLGSKESFKERLNIAKSYLKGILDGLTWNVEFSKRKETPLKLDRNKILFVYCCSPEEFESRSIGADRIQYELYKKYCTAAMSWSSFSGVLAWFYRIVSKSKRTFGKRTEDNPSAFSPMRYRWTLTSIIWFFEHIFLNDFFLKKDAIDEMNKYEVVIWGSILGVPYVKKLSKSKIIAVDHNASWLFISYHIEKIPILSRILVFLIKKIEIDVMKSADEVWCLSKNDAKLLRKYVETPQKIKVVFPQDITSQYTDRELGSLRRKLRGSKIHSILKGKFVIGFVGSFFNPNIIAVENTLEIAKQVPKDVTFLIMGSVDKAFRSRSDIPPNAIFTGYVDNLDSYLALCDAFINTKTTSDTGMEIKMLDYVKFNKPVISTEMGARGFERFNNLLICKNNKNAIKKIKELYLKAR